MKMHNMRDPIAEAADVGLRKSAREVLKDAREKVAVDDGDLRKSGRVQSTQQGEAIVKFTAPHAWLQHERLDYEHANGGQAKYLESAASEVDVAAIVAAQVKAILGG